MSRALDLTGQRFGMLTAVGRVGKTQSGSILWRCRCDCGRECHVAAAHLITPKPTVSCGCRKRQRTQVSDVFGTGGRIYGGRGKVARQPVGIRPYRSKKRSQTT